jgi:hypothetical protein
MKASEVLKSGIFNVCDQRWSPDGTAEVYVYRYGWKRAYRCVIRYKQGMKPPLPSSPEAKKLIGKVFTFDDLFDILEDEEVEEVI